MDVTEMKTWTSLSWRSQSGFRPSSLVGGVLMWPLLSRAGQARVTLRNVGLHTCPGPGPDPPGAVGLVSVVFLFSSYNPPRVCGHCLLFRA